ncbi:MAG: hypothetical protein ACKOI0_02935, partial [Actinomycetota bacterium]
AVVHHERGRTGEVGGVATGATAVAAVRWARARGAARGGGGGAGGEEGGGGLHRGDGRREADAVVVLETPALFLAVGDHYERFEQVGDDEVLAALGRAAA